MQRILFDGFFHAAPGHRLSRNISTGGYRTNVGRYSPFDVYHPNGCAMLLSDLLPTGDCKLSLAPLSEASLAEADILVLLNPDYPMYGGATPHRLDAPDLEALHGFLRRGGSAILVVNSFLSRSDFWEENFDLERIAPLFERLGLQWDHNHMSDENRILPASGGPFTVGYGQGGRVFGARLPVGAQPLLSFGKDVFGFVLPVGAGKLAVVGDAGLASNGLYHFPGFENAAFLRKLFSDMAPAWASGPAKGFERLEFGHLSCATSAQGISEDMFKALRPAAKFAVDHHYRHLTHEGRPEFCSPAEADAHLPVTPAAAAGQLSVWAGFPHVNMSDGFPAVSFGLELHVTEKRSASGTDYLISGNHVSERPGWADIGADPAAFGLIGELARVSTVVQIMAGTHADGSLHHYVMKQGQIAYIRNARNPHYGFDILLGSRNFVVAPTAAG
ncbi:MAG TPA: hypothetical protein PLF88_06865 [Opitutaceae bacterium]|nr:hypothetical protein [Opitutaceae bacterium]HRJ47203.1 hypothetical protein [Opitutaceae bacterium]